MFCYGAPALEIHAHDPATQKDAEHENHSQELWQHEQFSVRPTIIAYLETYVRNTLSTVRSLVAHHAYIHDGIIATINRFSKQSTNLRTTTISLHELPSELVVRDTRTCSSDAVKGRLPMNTDKRESLVVSDPLARSTRICRPSSTCHNKAAAIAQL